MINDFLKKVKEHAKNINYTSGLVCIRFSSMPHAFYTTAIAYLKKAYKNYCTNNIKIENFYIVFDNGKPFIEIVGNNNRTIVLIFMDNEVYSNFPAAFIENASKFEKSMRETDKNYNDRIKEKLPKEFIERYINSNQNITTIDELMEKSSDNILRYMWYLKNEEEKHMDVVSFKEPPHETYFPSKTSKPTVHKDRKNDEIEFEERKAILDKYPSLFRFKAKSDDAKSTYYVKVFKLPKKQFRIIMEPLEGNKYTKVLYINKAALKFKEAKTIVSDSLGLGRMAFAKKKNSTMHLHTSLEAYKNLMEYLTDSQDASVSWNTKKNIDAASSYTDESEVKKIK